MKKVLKSKIFIGSVVLLIIGALALAQFLTVRQKIEYITQEVEISDVKQTVSATGQVKSATDIELNFKTTGRLDFLNAYVGQKVSTDIELAGLRSVDFRIDIEKAQASLSEAQASFQKIISGATAPEIAISQAEVDKAQASLNSAQSDLGNNEIIYYQELQNAEENILIDIKSALSKAAISLNEINDTLNFEGDANNFTTSNFGLEQAVNLGYIESLEKLATARTAHELALINDTSKNLEVAADKSLNLLVSLEDTLSNLSSLLNFVVKSATLTQAKLDILKTTTNTEITTTNSSIDTVQTSNQDLLDAQINHSVKVIDAKNDIDTAQKALAKAQADLALKIAPPRVEDIQLYQAAVSRAQADLNLASERLSETKILAPQAGVITAINYEIGEQTALTNPVIEMSASENFKIEVDIPESDIAKVEVGDVVSVTLDAFTDDDILQALVTTIDPAETEIQDVIYFKVTVLLTEGQNEGIVDVLDRIKPGMTANINISTDEKMRVLAVPFRAVKELDGQRYVEVLINEEPVRVDVKLGLRGDDGEIEIVFGLTAGQQVITSVREK